MHSVILNFLPITFRHNEFCLNLEITMKSLDYVAKRLPEIERGNPWNLRTEKNGHNSRIWLVSTCGNSPEVKRYDVLISASRWGVMDSQMEPLASPLVPVAEV